MAHILLVEDDPNIGRGLVMSFEVDDFQVSWAKSLKEAKVVNEAESIDLVILDLGLPDGHGLDFCRHLREKNSRLPVLVLTAQLDEDSVVEALSAGANDYIRKPFGKKELMARIKVALREPVQREDQIRSGKILMLLGQRKVMVDGQEVELNRREFDLFEILLQNIDSVVSRERIISRLSDSTEMFDRTIDSHISHIRAKVKKAGVKGVKIRSEYGVGYRLIEMEEE